MILQDFSEFFLNERKWSLILNAIKHWKGEAAGVDDSV
jgi:hypothetical protein